MLLKRYDLCRGKGREIMVRIEASVVIKAPRKEVYEWFTKPENWAKYEGSAWKSVRIIKKERNVVTAMQEGVLERKSVKGTFKYKYSLARAEKIEGVWLEGNYGRTKFREQSFNLVFTDVPRSTKVDWTTDAEIPCAIKLFGSDGETKLRNMMQEELKKIQKTF